jgi:exopolysaccharide production protein ExoZ
MKTGLEKKVRFDSLQAMRGIAALAVVYFHIWVIASRFLNVTYQAPLAEMGNLGVDFFFVLSGFILTWVHYGDFGKSSQLLSYIVKRVVRIYPLLWILLSVKIAALIFLPNLSPVYKLDKDSILASYLLMPAGTYVIDVQWTLVYEAIFYLLLGVGLLCGKKPALMIAGAWIFAICAAKVTATQDAFGIYAQHLLSSRNLQFLAGAFTAVLLRKSFFPKNVALCALGVGFAVTIAGMVLGLREPVAWAFVFSSIVAAGASLDAIQFWKVPSLAVLLGNASYSIYMVHTSVQMLLVLKGKNLNLPFDSYGQLLLHLAGMISIVVGLICYKILETPLLNYFHRQFIKDPKASSTG